MININEWIVLICHVQNFVLTPYIKIPKFLFAVVHMTTGNYALSLNYTCIICAYKTSLGLNRMQGYALDIKCRESYLIFGNVIFNTP